MVQVKPYVDHILKTWLWYNCFPVSISKHASKTRTDRKKTKLKNPCEATGRTPDWCFNICFHSQLGNAFAILRVNPWAECINQWIKFSSFSPLCFEWKPETIFSNDKAEKSSLFATPLSFQDRLFSYLPPDKGRAIKKLSNLLRSNILKMEKNTWL